MVNKFEAVGVLNWLFSIIIAFLIEKMFFLQMLIYVVSSEQIPQQREEILNSNFILK